MMIFIITVIIRCSLSVFYLHNFYEGFVEMVQYFHCKIDDNYTNMHCTMLASPYPSTP